MFTTSLLYPAEAAFLLPVMGCYASAMSPETTEAAIADAGGAVHPAAGPAEHRVVNRHRDRGARRHQHHDHQEASADLLSTRRMYTPPMPSCSHSPATPEPGTLPFPKTGSAR
jgi:hypothetical protein